MTGKDINKAVAILFKAGFSLQEIGQLFKSGMVPDAEKCLWEFMTRPVTDRGNK